MIKDNFFDRELYLDILEKRVKGLLEGYRQNIAIIGDESVGKTSLIFNFLKKFCDNRIIIVYLEVRHEPIDSFAKRFISIMLYNFLSNSGEPLRENLDFLISKARKFIPKTVEKMNLVLSSIGRRKKNDIFTDLMSLCEIIHQETGKFCLVILDEFHELENIGFKCLYREWAKLLLAQKNTMYIIISSMKFKAKNILSKNLCLLFGNFEVITILPFDLKTTEQYIKDKLQGQNIALALKKFIPLEKTTDFHADAGLMPPSAQAVNPVRKKFSNGIKELSSLTGFIAHFTGGYPLYLEMVTDMLLKDEHLEQKNTPREHLIEILENLLFDSSGALNQKFSNYIKCLLNQSQSNDYISILYLISNGRNKIKDIGLSLRKSRKELDLRINRLLELDAISKSGDFLKLNDRVFSFWLKFVYQERLQCLSIEEKKQKEKFHDALEDMFQDFLANSQRPVTERVTELFRLFEDEVVQMERKKIRLNHFREIKTLEFCCKNLKDGILGRSSDSLWIMAFKREVLTEEDIAEFSKECKRYHQKLQRRIIVTFQDIDTNTRLKALEEKIWTWDINNLNQILDLFSKPWVIPLQTIDQ